MGSLASTELPELRADFISGRLDHVCQKFAHRFSPNPHLVRLEWYSRFGASLVLAPERGPRKPALMVLPTHKSSEKAFAAVAFAGGVDPLEPERLYGNVAIFGPEMHPIFDHMLNEFVTDWGASTPCRSFVVCSDINVSHPQAEVSDSGLLPSECALIRRALGENTTFASGLLVRDATVTYQHFDHRAAKDRLEDGSPYPPMFDLKSGELISPSALSALIQHPSAPEDLRAHFVSSDVNAKTGLLASLVALSQLSLEVGESVGTLLKMVIPPDLAAQYGDYRFLFGGRCFREAMAKLLTTQNPIFLRRKEEAVISLLSRRFELMGDFSPTEIRSLMGLITDLSIKIGSDGQMTFLSRMLRVMTVSRAEHNPSMMKLVT